MGDLYNHICYGFSELFGRESKCLISGSLLQKSDLADNGDIRFLVIDHMLPECLFFVLRTLFVRCNMWPFTVDTFWFPCFSIWATFVGMILTADETFLF